MYALVKKELILIIIIGRVRMWYGWMVSEIQELFSQPPRKKRRDDISLQYIQFGWVKSG